MTLQELTTLEKLNDAFYQCKRISAWKESTQRYESMLLINNTALQDELRNGAYKISPTSNFTINERGKLRNIEAPAMRDRIVQKILCKHILLPQLTPLLIYDNYASLPGRGTSFARERLERLLREYISKHGTDGYILQIDIKQYFPSIDHEILKQMMHDKIHESVEIMDLIDYLVDSSSNSDKGLNLGSEAPQIFALFYLSKVDNYIKCVKGIRYYGRYMDDMFVQAVKCDNCGDLITMDWSDYIVSSDAIQEDRGMGDEIAHTIEAKIECPHCGKDLSVSGAIYEYPVGAYNDDDLETEAID